MYDTLANIWINSHDNINVSWTQQRSLIYGCYDSWSLLCQHPSPSTASLVGTNRVKIRTCLCMIVKYGACAYHRLYYTTRQFLWFGVFSFVGAKNGLMPQRQQSITQTKGINPPMFCIFTHFELLTVSIIFFRVVSLVLGKLQDSPASSEVIPKYMENTRLSYFMIFYDKLKKHKKYIICKIQFPMVIGIFGKGNETLMGKLPFSVKHSHMFCHGIDDKEQVNSQRVETSYHICWPCI